VARGLVYALTHGAFAIRSGTTCAAIPACPACPTCPSSIQAGDLTGLILTTFILGVFIGVGLTVGALVISQITKWANRPVPTASGPDRRPDTLAISASPGLRAAVRSAHRPDGPGQ
jgi:hypothetical protein